MLLTTARLVFSTLCLSFTSAFTLSPRVVHEARDSLPHQWSPVRRADSNTVIPLRFGLKQSNLESIEKYVLDVSHPRSHNYGKHWDAEKVAETFRPSAEAVETVREWLIQSGVDVRRHRLGSGRGWLYVNVTIDEAERLLGTEYFIFQHSGDSDEFDERIACADKYHLPQHVSKHVDFVTPTLHFDVKPRRGHRQQKRDTETHSALHPMVQIKQAPDGLGKIEVAFDANNPLSNCTNQTTLACLRQLYNFHYTLQGQNNNTFGIVEYTPQAYVAEDLDLFFKNYSQNQVGQRPEMVSIDGGIVQTTNMSFSYNGESNLDLQYGMSLYGGPVTLYQTGDLIEGASFNNFLDALDGSYCTFDGGDDFTQDAQYPDPSPGGYTGPEACGTVKPANVISSSYGYNEADLTLKYAARQCAEYAKLALLGVTVLYSSGDDGVAGNEGLCLLSNGTQTANGTIFNPTFPGTCPYVTSVGATQTGPSVYEPETACETLIYSGGGFSNYFARPTYQDSAVEAYFENSPPNYPPSTYNTSASRGYPDVSANGANYVVYIDGAAQLVYGTSASSPTFATMMASINDARLSMGKSTIGFINPTIYSDIFTFAFNDITKGTNPGCGTPGFNASPGWDPVTGLGTPDFSALLTLWTSLD